MELKKKNDIKNHANTGRPEPKNPLLHALLATVCVLTTNNTCIYALLLATCAIIYWFLGAGGHPKNQYCTIMVANNKSYTPVGDIGEYTVRVLSRRAWRKGFFHWVRFWVGQYWRDFVALMSGRTS